ncbi:unnamed protein product [Sphagnum tenellum]
MYQGYTSFMQNIGKEAVKDQEEHHVKGVYTVKCKGTNVKGITTHYINVCESTKIDKPRVDDKVTVVVSKQRKGKESDGAPYYVYDAVVHTSIIQESKESPSFQSALIELALGCIEESFSLKLSPTRSSLKSGGYKGPYGWDSAGTAVDSDALLSKSSMVPAREDISKMTTTSLLTRIHCGDATASSSSGEEHELTSLVLPGTRSNGAIQDLGQLSDGAPESGSDLKLLARALDNCPHGSEASPASRRETFGGVLVAGSTIARVTDV